MTACLAVAGTLLALQTGTFSLSWQHSVEKTEWREDWAVTDADLDLVDARVRGSGAGMEPPEGSRLVDGWWVYQPALAPVPRLVLAASGATGSGWTLCADGACREIGRDASEPLVLEPCPR